MSKFFVCVLVLFVIYLVLNLMIDFELWMKSKSDKAYWRHFADVVIDTLVMFAFIYLMGGMN